MELVKFNIYILGVKKRFDILYFLGLQVFYARCCCYILQTSHMVLVFARASILSAKQGKGVSKYHMGVLDDTG